MEPIDKERYADGPARVNLGTEKKPKLLDLSLEDRMELPAFAKSWWDELFEHGVAQYFGIDTDCDFNHVYSGVYGPYNSDKPVSKTFVDHFTYVQEERDKAAKKERKRKRKDSKKRRSSTSRKARRVNSDDDGGGGDSDGGGDEEEEEEEQEEQEQEETRPSPKKRRK